MTYTHFQFFVLTLYYKLVCPCVYEWMCHVHIHVCTCRKFSIYSKTWDIQNQMYMIEMSTWVKSMHLLFVLGYALKMKYLFALFINLYLTISGISKNLTRKENHQNKCVEAFVIRKLEICLQNDTLNLWCRMYVFLCHLNVFE